MVNHLSSHLPHLLFQPVSWGPASHGCEQPASCLATLALGLLSDAEDARGKCLTHTSPESAKLMPVRVGGEAMLPPAMLRERVLNLIPEGSSQPQETTSSDSLHHPAGSHISPLPAPSRLLPGTTQFIYLAPNKPVISDLVSGCILLGNQEETSPPCPQLHTWASWGTRRKGSFSAHL